MSSHIKIALIVFLGSISPCYSHETPLFVNGFHKKLPIPKLSRNEVENIHELITLDKQSLNQKNWTRDGSARDFRYLTETTATSRARFFSAYDRYKNFETAQEKFFPVKTRQGFLITENRHLYLTELSWARSWWAAENPKLNSSEEWIQNSLIDAKEILYRSGKASWPLNEQTLAFEEKSVREKGFFIPFVPASQSLSVKVGN